MFSVPKIGFRGNSEKKTLGKHHDPVIFPNKRKKHITIIFLLVAGGGLFPTISCWVQAPVEKETQKPSFWE